MRKPRDFDAEMKALGERTKQLRARKVQQLGELVIACQADSMPVEQLAGVLLAAATSSDPSAREVWRKRGAAFFQGTATAAEGIDRQSARGARARDGAAPPAPTDESAQ